MPANDPGRYNVRGVPSSGLKSRLKDEKKKRDDKKKKKKKKKPE